jgi:hypothetical protein
MYRGNGNVRGVRSGLTWDFSSSQDAGGQFRDLGRDIQQREFPQPSLPCTRSGRVSCADFVDDELREEKLERVSTAFPPFPRDLLMAGNAFPSYATLDWVCG